jgi:uncharacterized membrane protein
MQVNRLLKFSYLFLLICGFLLFLVGLFFKLFHWPDMFNGIYVGPVFIILGVVIFIISKRKNRL